MADEVKLIDPSKAEYRVEFWKRNPGDIIWAAGEYVDDEPVCGKMLISFDKKKLYNIYADYPDNMTDKEVEIFKKEYPDWVKWLE